MWRRIYIKYSTSITIGGITSLDSLYEEVHYIAYYYKWGEKEILSLPVFKRKKYLELIEKQVKAENADPDDEANSDIYSSPSEDDYDEDYS